MIPKVVYVQWKLGTNYPDRVHDKTQGQRQGSMEQSKGLVQTQEQYVVGATHSQDTHRKNMLERTEASSPNGFKAGDNGSSQGMCHTNETLGLCFAEDNTATPTRNFVQMCTGITFCTIHHAGFT